MWRFLFISLLLTTCSMPDSEPGPDNGNILFVSHGPLLGHVTDQSVRIWARTSLPGEFKVEYADADAAGQVNWSKASTTTVSVQTELADDNTGWTTITGLQANSHYGYRVFCQGQESPLFGTFKTLPAVAQFKNEVWNPKGLFNFSFEYGSCASQNPKNGIGPSLPTYTTMLEKVKDDIHFAVMNGDWLYEENRDYPLSGWLGQQDIDESAIPLTVRRAPAIVGVWENYRTYLSRGKNLSEWHRHVPSYFTFDDHELVNDIWGAGEIGRRDRRAVFRDIGTAAWYDYLGWANPTDFHQDIYFGEATLEAGSDVLVDNDANFTQLDPTQMANLHVHWGTTTAGVDQIALDIDSTGNPNSRVYGIREILGPDRLKISPPAQTSNRAPYSIGRQSYAEFSVANCDFYLLDTRTNRQMHDVTQRDKPGLTILGDQQRNWLMESMEESQADFFFVFSSVPFMIPHIGAGGYEAAPNKDEAWTVFVDEREKLITFWEELGKPVFVLTGDLHNSFAIKITDHIWEFCSGPHNSVNHRLTDEGHRPRSGLYRFEDQREIDIRWSTFILDDLPRPQRLYPHYCVVQVNNAFNNPVKLGGERWVAYEHPQVIFKYYDGRTGAFRYSETISTKRHSR